MTSNKRNKPPDSDSTRSASSRGYPSTKDVPLRKVVQKLQMRMSELSKRLLEVEGDAAGSTGILKLVNTVQSAILELAPRTARLEDEVRRLRGRVDAWGVHTERPPADAPEEYRSHTAYAQEGGRDVVRGLDGAARVFRKPVKDDIPDEEERPRSQTEPMREKTRARPRSSRKHRPAGS